MTPSLTITPQQARMFFMLGCLILFAAFFNAAWVSDDAFITFRSVRNLIEGYGPVWNIDERVQVYTHPLWFLLLSAVTYMIGDPYWASFALSAACLFGSVYFVYKLSESPLIAALFLIALSLSKVFIDYTTSGLENPLSCFLAAAMFYFYLKHHQVSSGKSLLLTLLCGSLLSLNRFDLFLIALPVAAMALFHARHIGAARIAGICIASALPTLVWLAFATYYYGSPLPNTYFAKLSTLIPADQLLEQGIAYLAAFVKYDIGSFLILIAGIALGARGKLAPFTIGMALYIFYSIKTGGDFMVGRFYTVPVFIAFLVILKSEVISALRAQSITVMIAVGIPSIFVTVLTPSNYSDYYISERGIANERGYYTLHTGLRRNIAKPVRMTHPFAQMGIAVAQGNASLVESCYVGMMGFYANNNTTIVDGYGLTDPLLARLPAIYPWRIGHFERPAPDGYYKILTGNDSQLSDASLDSLWQDLYLAHRAPLDSDNRLAAIWRLHTDDWKSHVLNSNEVQHSQTQRKASPYHCRGIAGASYTIIASHGEAPNYNEVIQQ